MLCVGAIIVLHEVHWRLKNAQHLFVSKIGVIVGFNQGLDVVISVSYHSIVVVRVGVHY